MIETGIDIVDISRLQAAITRHGERFITKIFHPDEIRYCEDKARIFEHYAVRFAAKEAARKILLSRLSFNPGWTETCIVNDKNGKPHLKLDQKILRECPVLHTSVSLSHTKTLATAIVLMELRGDS